MNAKIICTIIVAIIEMLVKIFFELKGASKKACAI